MPGPKKEDIFGLPLNHLLRPCNIATTKICLCEKCISQFLFAKNNKDKTLLVIIIVKWCKSLKEKV